MAKYIEVEALKRELSTSGIVDTYGTQVLLKIDSQPAADVVEVRHGEWVHSDKAAHWFGKDECSECHYHTYDNEDLSHFNYCPNCGARMDGKGESE